MREFLTPNLNPRFDPYLGRDPNLTAYHNPRKKGLQIVFPEDPLRIVPDVNRLSEMRRGISEAPNPISGPNNAL